MLIIAHLRIGRPRGGAPNRCCLLLLAALVALAPLSPLPSQEADAAQVQLAWDQNPEPDIGGYKVHYGTGSRSYLYAVDVGPATGCVVSGLQEGMLYYFSVTAYNASAMQSDFSNEVYCSVPSAPTTPPPRTHKGRGKNK